MIESIRRMVKWRPTPKKPFTWIPVSSNLLLLTYDSSLSSIIHLSQEQNIMRHMLREKRNSDIKYQSLNTRSFWSQL